MTFMDFFGTPAGGTVLGGLVLIIGALIRMWLMTHTNKVRIEEHEKLCTERGTQIKETVHDIKTTVDKVDAKVDRVVHHLLEGGAAWEVRSISAWAQCR